MGVLTTLGGPSNLKSAISYRSAWRIPRVEKLGPGRRRRWRKRGAGGMVRIARRVLKGRWYG